MSDEKPNAILNPTRRQALSEISPDGGATWRLLVEFFARRAAG
jgi:hypothetical protein